MCKTTSSVSKMSTVIAVCGAVLAVGALVLSAYPAYASNPQATNASKSPPTQQTSRRLTVKDWVMITKSM